MKCPTCGFPGAYVGLKEVECKNRDCAHYAKQDEMRRQVRELADEWDIETEKIIILPGLKRMPTRTVMPPDSDWNI
jgi:hypothetical protein